MCKIVVSMSDTNGSWHDTWHVLKEIDYFVLEQRTLYGNLQKIWKNDTLYHIQCGCGKKQFIASGIFWHLLFGNIPLLWKRFSNDTVLRCWIIYILCKFEAMSWAMARIDKKGVPIFKPLHSSKSSCIGMCYLDIN